MSSLNYELGCSLAKSWDFIMNLTTFDACLIVPSLPTLGLKENLSFHFKSQVSKNPHIVLNKLWLVYTFETEKKEKGEE